MNKNKAISFLLMFFISSAAIYSQALVENELTSNPTLVEWTQKRGMAYKAGSIADTVTLGPKGILEDFTNDSFYPDTALWLDNFVLVNRGYGRAPVSYGVATFDGLNGLGYPYDFLAASGSSGPADVLTSKAIDLNYLPSDSVYFSFLYQPQGNGNAPEAKDSLVLQFKQPGVSDSLWENVWATKGISLTSSDSSWTLVMIPITATKFLQKGFQFRFKNYATRSGNVDHWNVDYIYLNKTRVLTDTLFEDIAFVYGLPSLLTDYSAVPWKHHSASLMKTTYQTTIRNNHNVTKNGTFGYKIYDRNGVQQNTTYSGGSFNIDPFVPNGYMNYAPFTTPSINYSIPSLTDTNYYYIDCFANSTPDFHRKNDTIRHYQRFEHHYAYDDGTAETSFGLSTLYGQIAQKFYVTTADTLQAFDIYWNPVLVNVAQIYTFNLRIWNEVAGIPGTVLFTDTTDTPVYNQTGYNGFTRHYLKKGKLYLNPGTYYFGFRQNTTQFLNVGVDRNTNTQNKVYYNVTGSWVNSPYPGSVMLRPVFGAGSEFTGVENNVNVKPEKITLYPNPANNVIFIDGLAEQKNVINFQVIDLYGRVVKEVSNTANQIDVSDIANGNYILRIISGKNIYHQKFIVLK